MSARNVGPPSSTLGISINLGEDFGLLQGMESGFITSLFKSQGQADSS